MEIDQESKLVRPEIAVPAADDAQPARRTISGRTGYLFVFGAGAIWGSMGLFFAVLHDSFGLSALNIAFLRAAIPAVILLVALRLFQPSLLRIPRAALRRYLAFGLIGIALFYIFVIEGVILTSVATASVLLYTAPAFVTLFAWWLWREPITPQKLIALVTSFVGCALVAGAYDPRQLSLNWAGILVATLAGFGYAIFTLFSKASTGQSPWTTITYALTFGALFLLPLQLLPVPGLGGAGLRPLVDTPASWLYALGMALGPTLGSYLLYNTGLKYVPASNASIVASIEPVVAGVLGFLLLGQQMAPLQIVGAVMVIGAAVWLSRQ